MQNAEQRNCPIVFGDVGSFPGFPWGMLKKFWMSSRVSGGELGRDSWEIMDFYEVKSR